MKVIIKKTGEIKDVAFGYAVNYLIPKGLAERATEEKIKKLEEKKNLLIIQKNEEKELLQKELQRIKNQKIIIKVKTAKGKKTFGSVTKKQILNKLGLAKNKAKVLLEKPLKELGKHKIKIKIGNQETEIIVELIKNKN